MKKQITVEMKDILIRPVDVLEKMKKLKENKAPGIDKIHHKVLKRCCYTLSLPLSMLFNKSLCESRLPQIWKDANITPIHKKGPKSKAENYQPISLTSIPCKLLEELIKDQIISHLRVNNLISSVQHGFTERRSCLTNLLITLEMITKAIDEDCPVDTIYFDFSKAFDTVPHYRLLQKLKSMGINKTTFLWIKDFLSERRQRVVINGVKSQWGVVKSGVPQGSVLGPILFLIYVSDISDDVSSNVILFADDTKLYSRVERQEDCHTLQEDINKLVNWSEKWLMRFNTEKCKVLHFGHNNKQQHYFMKDSKLSTTKEEKDLGVLITDNLKPSSQCTAAVNKTMSALRWSKRSFHYLDIESFRILYKTYIRPNLEFVIQAWSTYLDKDIKIMEKIQRQATKMVPALRHLQYEDRLKKLGIYSLAARRLRGDLIETFKLLHGHTNIDYEIFF